MARAAVLLVLVLAAASVVAAGYAAGARLGLLAVNPEAEKGLVIYADVSLSSPGGGEVTVKPGGLVDEVLYLSTRLAFQEGLVLAHRSPLLYDASVSIETSTNVGGPSASGFIAAALMDLARGLEPDTTNTTMTGMVSLTGLVLPVAGVPLKVEAAAGSGFHRILLPAPEANMTSVAGVEVVPVCSVEHAAALLAGLRGWSPQLPGLRGLPGSRSFAEAAELFSSMAEKLLEGVPEANASTVRADLERARELLNTSPYAAASLAFHGLYRAARYWELRGDFKRVEEAVGMSLGEALQAAGEAIDSRRPRGGACDLWRLEALAAAEYRLVLARDVEGKDDSLALLRALSAKLWAETSDELHGPVYNCTTLMDALERLADYARDSYSYVRRLVNARLVTVGNVTLDKWVERLDQALREGDPVAVLAYSIYIISDLESRLAAGQTLDCLERHAAALLEEAGPLGLFPAAHYISYALAYSSGSMDSREVKAYMLGLAAAWAYTGLYIDTVAATPSAPAAAPAATGGGGAGAGIEEPVAAAYIVSALAAVVAAAAARAGGGQQRGGPVAA